MCEIPKKTYGEPPINTRTCYNHARPLVYPIEYEECPGCGLQKIIRSDLELIKNNTAKSQSVIISHTTNQNRKI
jgi:hypothetical protein